MHWECVRLARTAVDVISQLCAYIKAQAYAGEGKISESTAPLGSRLLKDAEVIQEALHAFIVFHTSLE